MKWRRVAILVTVFSLMGGSLLFADSSQKMRLLFNGLEVEDGGYVIEGKTYIPARDLNGMIEYNESTKTVNYNKPNVHMFLFAEETVFGDIKKTGKLKFNVFSQIDNLKTDISAVRVSITAPDGSSKVIQTSEIKEQRDTFWFRTEDYTYDFKTAGKYIVGFYMKSSSGTDFSLVAEKGITVLK
ncbi:hypothetical protein SAMN04488542_105100 [Fontibacillus panacisegetis]|uniref:Copper amine oxidase N-terminal domain-containing protein n=1 Tax=Fontibacillus panacisegetis TaxID=670482 RepID=A0A1G7HZP1_9BACL|nr:copper amine oxidase [Fontibacillus panacisegetis]SDF05932.1 hypothetical protein SAMN04488542_105100 [Fontibacillus panacisegetis]